MVTLDLVLGLMKTELDIVLVMVQSMTPEQRQALWTRHEARLERWDKLVDRLTSKLP